MSQHEQNLKNVTRFANRKDNPTVGKSPGYLQGLILSQKQLQRFRQKLEKYHAFDYSRFSKKIAQHLQDHVSVDAQATRSTALKYEVEIEDDLLHVRVVSSNQRFCITIDQLFEMVLDHFSQFWEQHCGNLKDLSAKLVFVLDLRNFPREDIVRGLFWHNKPLIQIRLTRQGLRNYLIRNFDCRAIRGWLDRQMDLGGVKGTTHMRSELRVGQRRLQSFLFPKINPGRRVGESNDIKESSRTETNSSLGSVCKVCPDDQAALPGAHELFAVLLCVHDRLLEHSVAKKFDMISQEMDVSSLHKENLVKLTKDMVRSFQNADPFERSLILTAIRKIDSKKGIVPINFEVNSLEGMLQKQSGMQGESMAYYLKYFKNCFRQDAQNASPF